MDATDQELLRQFATGRSEQAFRRLVDRHVGMVFAVALRVCGDRSLAEEIAQTTFTTLARKAGQLSGTEAPAGWLYHTARHLALRSARSEQRRRKREQLAAHMTPTDEPGQETVAEHLESAMDQLNPDERDALVLRFFEGRSLRDVGREFGLTDDAARMRVNRALEKLRGIFGKLGITGTTTWLAATLPTSAGGATPAGLGAAISSAVLGATATAAALTTTAATTSTMSSLLNLKTAAVAITAAAVTGTSTYIARESENETLRADLVALSETNATLASDRQQAFGTLQLRDRQIEQLKNDIEDVHRLRGEVDRLNRELAGMSALKSELHRLQQELLAARAKPAEGTQAPQLPTHSGGPSYDDEFLERYGLWNEEQIAEAKVRRLNKHRVVGLGLIMYADANQGWFPERFEDVVLYLNSELDGKRPELLYSGAISQLADPAHTIVARQAGVSKSLDGREVWRVYTFADGHSEIKAAANINELTAWENERIVHTP